MDGIRETLAALGVVVQNPHNFGVLIHSGSNCRRFLIIAAAARRSEGAPLFCRNGGVWYASPCAGAGELNRNIDRFGQLAGLSKGESFKAFRRVLGFLSCLLRLHLGEDVGGGFLFGCAVLDGFKGFRGGVLLQIPTCENVGGGLGFNLFVELVEGFGFVFCYCLFDVRVSLGDFFGCAGCFFLFGCFPFFGDGVNRLSRLRLFVCLGASYNFIIAEGLKICGCLFCAFGIYEVSGIYTAFGIAYECDSECFHCCYLRKIIFCLLFIIYHFFLCLSIPFFKNFYSHRPTVA
nr:MAG TPA: hypothetical protein [Caudoviricetes sp.]